MTSMFFLAIGLFLLSFTGDVDIPAAEFEKAVQVCASHGGLKALNAEKFFGQRHYSALCADDSRISGGK